MRISDMSEKEQKLVRAELMNICNSRLIRPLEKSSTLDDLFAAETSEDALRGTSLRYVEARFKEAGCGYGLRMEVEVKEVGVAGDVGSSYYQISRELTYDNFSDSLREAVKQRRSNEYVLYGSYSYC